MLDLLFLQTKVSIVIVAHLSCQRGCRIYTVESDQHLLLYMKKAMPEFFFWEEVVDILSPPQKTDASSPLLE